MASHSGAVIVPADVIVRSGATLPVAAAGYSVTEPPAKLATNSVPSPSTASPLGCDRCVAAPAIVFMGAALPVELAEVLATKMCPALSTAIPWGFDKPVAEPERVWVGATLPVAVNG